MACDPDLEQLQRRVIEAIIAGSPNREVLAAQYAVASFRPTELTGVGFYRDIDVPDGVPRYEPATDSPGDVIMESETLPAGAGFVLFVRSGKICLLEGYSFDGPWPSELGSYTLRRVALRRGAGAPR